MAAPVRCNAWFGVLLHVRIGIVISYEVQDNAMLKQRFAACQKETEATHRVNGLHDLFVIGSSKTRRGDAHKGCVVTSWGEHPFDRSRPLNEDSSVVFDSFHRDLCRGRVHVPVPR